VFPAYQILITVFCCLRKIRLERLRTLFPLKTDSASRWTTMREFSSGWDYCVTLCLNAIFVYVDSETGVSEMWLLLEWSIFSSRKLVKHWLLTAVWLLRDTGLLMICFGIPAQKACFRHIHAPWLKAWSNCQQSTYGVIVTQ